MNAKHPRPHAPIIKLGDIYYILFRHKWKIVILGMIGVIAALIMPLFWTQTYQAEASLLIKYVADTRMPTGPSGDGSRTMFPDESGRNIINTELQILTSLDLALDVATNVTPAKILGHPGNEVDAASVVHSMLLVEVPLNSDVIRLTYRNTDPAMAQLVLSSVIKSYLERHDRIHRPGGESDILTAGTEDLATRLKTTEAQLTAIKTNLNITSLEDSRKIFGDQINRIKEDIRAAEVDLAEHQATYEELAKRGDDPAGHRLDTGTSTGTNDVTAATGTNTVADQSGTNQAKLPATAPVAPEKIAEYKSLSSLADALRAQEKELLATFTPENSRVKSKQEQVANTDKKLRQMEQDEPGLVASAKVEGKANADTGVAEARFMEESIRIAALQRKIQVLTNQLTYIQSRATVLDANAANINQLERDRASEAASYEHYKESLLTSLIDETVGPGKASNISIIQKPFVAGVSNAKLKQARIGLALAGIMIGLGLAFLIEIYIDRTVRRPADLESRIGVPMFLSIPYRNGKGDRRLLKAPPKPTLVLRSDLLDRTVVLNGSKTTVGRAVDSTVVIEDVSISQHHCEIVTRNGEVMVKDLGSTNGTFVDGSRIMESRLLADQVLRVGTIEFRVQAEAAPKTLAVSKKNAPVTPPWDPRHALRPFYDTLRDRLITYFEVKNLTHNPKLVALTSCGGSAGVSSTAAGLAAALSETGEGNVLLVDMNVERGAAHHFYKGHLSCGIDEALTKDKRHEARVQDNLYVVTESNSEDEDSLPRVLPKRFMSLVPKLKASDYDYIIFDMPPMSEISITPRLARFMDMMLVVVESEKTDRDVVQRAVTMLTETRANVGVVINKSKNYVPKRIQQEL